MYARLNDSSLLRNLLWVPVIGLGIPIDAARAQTGGPFDLTWSTVDSGGAMRSQGGAFELCGTIGQYDAGMLTGGASGLAGGFWSAAADAAPCDCQLFGDMAPEGGDCSVDVGDILMLLDAFPGVVICPDCDLSPCGGDGNTDVCDISAVLDAFSGIFSWPHPFPA
jgi:hypothetical protein